MPSTITLFYQRKQREIKEMNDWKTANISAITNIISSSTINYKVRNRRVLTNELKAILPKSSLPVLQSAEKGGFSNELV